MYPPSGPLADERIRGVLSSVRTIAMVGASNRPDRPSFEVMAYLMRHGYRVIPVNPGLAGQEIHGMTVAGHLTDIGEPVDMVDVFRQSFAVPAVVEEAVALDPRPKIVWMQIGVVNEDAARTAEAAGMTVVMDRCPKIEIARLFGGASPVGVGRTDE